MVRFILVRAGVRLLGALATFAAIGAMMLVPSALEARQQHHRHLPRQHGGRVHHAWPSRRGRDRPPNPLARWLARQVGPVRVSGRGRHSRHGALLAQAVSAAAGSVPFQTTGTIQALSLVRSYQIPSDDPSAVRLANLSWTYDSAVTAVAFEETGNVAQAQQLLDQLKALQRTDGSIDFAFNTATGQSIPEFRTGTIAWTGLAAADYRAATCSSSYDAVAYGAAKWLLSEQLVSPSAPAYGLIRGGPDVTWVSTQHNLIARAFLAHLADAIDGNLRHGSEGRGNGNGPSCPGGLSGLTGPQASAFSAQLHHAVALLDAGISAELYVRLTPGTAAQAGIAYFKEGVGDDVRPADAQALGALWLLSQGRTQDAQAVVNYANQSMSVSNRSVALSAKPLTYNETYSSPGPFSGYLPYADPGTPSVLWLEGTLEMRFAEHALGDDTSTLDRSIVGWQGITGFSTGPLQADKTVVGNIFNEYHPWPDSAAAAWELLNLTSFSLLSTS